MQIYYIITLNNQKHYISLATSGWSVFQKTPDDVDSLLILIVCFLIL